MELLDRMAIIVELAHRKTEHQGRLGKTALMKLLYLLQEIYGVPIGYRFSLYTYGPYVSEVMSDIDYAEAVQAINVRYEPESGYKISAATEPSSMPPPNEAIPAIERLLIAFGNFNARDLELRSTIIFAHKNMKSENLVALVKEIKPRFSESEIAAAVSELKHAEIL